LERKIVRVSRIRELTETNELKVQGDDAALGKIDATLLFVFHPYPIRLMSEQVQNGGNTADNLCRLIKKRGRVEAGHNFKTQFVNRYP